MNRHIRSVFFRLAIVVVGLTIINVLTGCDRHTQAAQPPAGRFRVVPLLQPLDDDATRLAQHLGTTVLGIDVSYPGPKKALRIDYEIWHKGQAIKRQMWMGSSIPHPLSEWKLTFSKRSLTWMSEPIEIELATVGSNACVGRFPLPKLSQPTSSVKILPADAEFSDSEEPAVLAFVWGDGCGLFKGDESVEVMAQRVEYAIVMRVGFDNNP